MSNIFHQKEGDVIEWVAASDITANDFIDVGGKIGVALNSGLTGEKVTLKLTGVVKAATVEDLSAGDVVGINPAPTNTAAAAGSVTAAGVVTADNNAGATVLVRLNA